MNDWWGDYVGLRFVDGGRTRSAIDCWGLCRLVLKERANIDVPTYGGISAMDLGKVATVVSDAVHFDGIWNLVTQPDALDVAVMRQGRGPAHLGIMISPTMLLHAQEASNSVVVAIKHPSVAFRLKGFYRHKDLM